MGLRADVIIERCALASVMHAGCIKIGLFILYAQSHMHSFTVPCIASTSGLQTAAGRDLLAESAFEISLRTPGAHTGAAAFCQTHAAATHVCWQIMSDTA